MRQIEEDFLAEAYALDFKVNDKRVVHKAFVRFRGLLYELGLSAHQDEVLAVKLEIDTNPPAGAILATTSLKRYVALNLQHHDRASLLAGKLHAVLQRVYPKGRDIYDLWWYLSQPEWDAPNLALLNQALAQSDWQGPVMAPDNWRGFVRRRLEELDWQKDVLHDIQAFLITPEWEKQVDKKKLLGLLT